MATGTVFVVVALLSLAGLGVTHKVADFRRCKPDSVNVMLFFWAAVMFWGYACFHKSLFQDFSFFPPFTTKAVIWAVACGALASIAILTFQTGIRYGRISTSWLVVNLSTALPAVLSLVIYREWRQGIGWQQPVALVLVMVSVILLWRDKALEIARGDEPVPDQSLDTDAESEASRPRRRDEQEQR